MTLAAVLIGRNEGDRLIRALDAAKDLFALIVYVDSGSTDQSVLAARERGAQVVELDMSIPFTAARARNAGYEAVKGAEYVQFIDGDCALVPEFVKEAIAYLKANEDVGIVTGWRRELYPQKTVYNLLCHLEWDQPAGQITNCGGDMMVRAKAFEGVGGFNPQVIAAEDDDFCLRVGQAGWRLWRLPIDMTFHDVDMHHFQQWWKRAERAGHGFAQVDHLHPGHFRKAKIRVAVYAVVLPLLALILVPWGALIALAIYALSTWRSYQYYVKQDSIAPDQALKLAGLLTLSKFPNLIGLLKFYRRLVQKDDMRLIEYK